MATKEPETGTEQARQIGQRKLKNLAGSARAHYRDQRRLAGTLGEALRNAVEHDNLHLKAFRAVMAEDRMEAAELADFYAAQDFYRDQLGLLEKARSAPRLELETPEADEDEDKTDGRRRRVHVVAAE